MLDKTKRGELTALYIIENEIEGYYECERILREKEK